MAYRQYRGRVYHSASMPWRRPLGEATSEAATLREDSQEASAGAAERRGCRIYPEIAPG
jgi:hypothetical protein